MEPSSGMPWLHWYCELSHTEVPACRRRQPGGNRHLKARRGSAPVRQEAPADFSIVKDTQSAMSFSEYIANTVEECSRHVHIAQFAAPQKLRKRPMQLCRTRPASRTRPACMNCQLVKRTFWQSKGWMKTLEMQIPCALWTDWLAFCPPLVQVAPPHHISNRRASDLSETDVCLTSCETKFSIGQFQNSSLCKVRSR